MDQKICGAKSSRRPRHTKGCSAGEGEEEEEEESQSSIFSMDHVDILIKLLIMLFIGLRECHFNLKREAQFTNSRSVSDLCF